MKIKKQKIIIKFLLLLFVLSVLFFIILKFKDIKNYQNPSQASQGYAKAIQDIKNSSQKNCACLSSLYNLSGFTYYNKAKLLFFKDENYQKAEIAFQLSLDNLKKISNGEREYDLFRSFVYNNLAWTYYKHAQFIKSDKIKIDLFKKAIKNYNEVSDTSLNKNKHLFEKIQCNLFMSDSNKNLGIIAIKDGNFKDAEVYFKDAEKNLKEVDKIINNNNNENDVIKSSKIWCNIDGVIHYFNVINNDKDYKEFKKNIIEPICRSIDNDIKNKLKPL